MSVYDAVWVGELRMAPTSISTDYVAIELSASVEGKPEPYVQDGVVHVPVRMWESMQVESSGASGSDPARDRWTAFTQDELDAIKAGLVSELRAEALDNDDDHSERLVIAGKMIVEIEGWRR